MLKQDEQQQHASLYWEFHHWNGDHAQAVRIRDTKNGDWKAVRIYNKHHRDNPPIELYNLKRDTSESTNVATKNPAVVAQAEKLMRSSRKRSLMDQWNFDYWPNKKY